MTIDYTQVGRTPLHLAAQNDQEEVITNLIMYGADIRSKDKMGRYEPVFLLYIMYMTVMHVPGNNSILSIKPGHRYYRSLDHCF